LSPVFSHGIFFISQPPAHLHPFSF